MLTLAFVSLVPTATSLDHPLRQRASTIVKKLRDTILELESDTPDGHDSGGRESVEGSDREEEPTGSEGIDNGNGDGEEAVIAETGT